MIYITGDTHGEYARFKDPALSALNSGDLLIVAGDFGCIFFGDERDERKLDAIAGLPFEVAFIDGNHENFPRIYSYPEENWHGGKVHRIRSNLRHLMRGQVFELEGLTIFTMGGGYSIDKMYRIPGRSWWEEEMPDPEEYEEGRRNLAKAGSRVDVIVSHAAPMDAMEHLQDIGIFQTVFPQESELNLYLQSIREQVHYERYFFGHLHMDREMPNRERALYYDIFCLNTGEKLPSRTASKG